MKIEYDPARDLLCLWLATPGTTPVPRARSARQFNREGCLIGLDVRDASDGCHTTSSLT